MVDATTKAIPDPARTPRLLVATWFALGAALAFAGVLGRAPQLGPVFIAGSAVAWIAIYRRRGATRLWLDQLPVRLLVGLHAIRLPIGAAFLWEASRGQLAPLFAQRAGIGDILIGALAIAVAGLARRKRSIVVAFSVIGLVDILIALGTGMYLMFGVRDPLMLGAIARLPYPLLPLGIVPAVILTHVLVLARRGT